MIKQKLILLGLLLFGLIIVLNIHIVTAANVSTTEIGANDKISDYSSAYSDNYIKSGNSTVINKALSTSNVTSKSIVASTGESNTNNRADISITSIASNYNPNYMKYVIIVLLVKNNGPNTAENVVASYRLNQTYFKWIKDDGNGSYNRLTGAWTVGNIENSTTRSLHIVVQIISSNINIKNYATYIGSTIDPNALNNRDSINLIVPPAADIIISQTSNKYNPKYLYHDIISIVVKNNGPNLAENVTVNYWLDPQILRYLSDDGNGSYNFHTGIWTIGKLNNGAQVILNIRTKIMVFNTVIKNIASYQSNTYDQTRSNNRAGIVLTIPGLTINSLATSLVIGKTSSYDKAVNIFNWVRDYVDYSFYYGTRYGTTGTLDVLKGNCVDLSHLIVALAREAGLSARYKYGNCYFFNGQEWISHVWANIYVKGPRGLTWYSADASNNINDFDTIRNWNTTNFKLIGIYSILPF